ncbi:Severe Depolymerization of Actin [Rhodotorula kratochvilovae]
MPSVAAPGRPAASVAGSRASNRSRATTASTPAGEGLRKTQRGALITNSLPALQNLIKRSPESYAEEFAVQWARFGSLVKIVQLGLGGAKADEEQLKEVTGFVCQVAHLYPTLTTSLPSILSGLLLSSAPATSTSNASTAAGPAGNSSAISGGGVQLGPETRKTMMQGLVLLRRRDVITGVDLLKTLFPLLSITTSPNLRTFILKTIIGDIKNANMKSRANKLNSMVQGLLMAMIDRGIAAEQERVGTGVKASRRGASTSKDGKVVGAREAMWAVKIASELWRKNVWRGDKMTVKVVARACFHPDTKVQSAAMHFFLVTPDGEADLDSDDEEDGGPDIQQVKHRQEINKKRKSTERKARRDIRSAGARQRAKEQAAKNPQTNFSALQQLDDAYSFGERLYEQLVKYDKAYTLEHKVLMMQLLGRVCGAFKLTIAAFYSYVLRYLTHHQLQITQILVALAQSVHDQIPAGSHDNADDAMDDGAQQEQDDPLYPVLRKIANEFVHSGVAAEVNAAGLNAITEICRRQPLAMSPDLLQDLVEYRKSKDKGVMVAARGLLQLYREVNPTLLKRRDVGKSVSLALQEERRGGAEAVAAGAEVRKTSLKFGEDRDTVKGIQGLDLFAKHLAEQAENADGETAAADEDDEAGWDGWEAESGSESDSSGGWVNVDSEGESDLEISDSDDDDEDKARKRRKVEAREAKKRALDAVEEEDEDEAAPVKKRVVDVAGTKADDEVRFDEESGSEEDDEGSDAEEDSDDEEEVKQAPRPRTEEEQDEMSLTRANKVLEGTTFAEIAMTKILTPADFVKINELRMEAAEDEAKNGGGSAARRKLAALSAARKANHGDADDAFLAEGDILGMQKKGKNNYEERMAKIQEGRADREKFGSHKHKKLDSKAHSTTNAEKRRSKNFMMMAHSHQVVRKSRASLHQKSTKLRKHVQRQKSGRRRNGEHK